MGITHHTHGVQNVEAITNLAYFAAWLADRTPVVADPRTLEYPRDGFCRCRAELKEAVFQRLESHYNIKLPTSAGLDTMACIEAADAGRLKFGFCLGGNLFGSNPDAQYADSRAGKISTLLVQLNTTLNTGHARGLARETIVAAGPGAR